MTIINPTGISGITSFTSSGSRIDFYASNGSLATFNSNINATSGVSTFTTINVGTFTTTSFASASDVIGVTTTGVTTSTNTTVTLSGTNVTINNGDSVTGLGIPSGTTVASGAGTVRLILSAPVGVTSSVNSLSFYQNTKPLSAGRVGGQLCRAWVNFDGVSATPRIRAAYNVSSITDNGTGDYTVNFTTALPDINYSAVALTSPNYAVNNSLAVQINVLPGFGSEVAPTTTTVRIGTANAGGTFFDAKYVYLVIFR
jgi:hypothetical protein